MSLYCFLYSFLNHWCIRMTLDNSVLYFQPVKSNCMKALPHSNCLKGFPNSECDVVTSMTLTRYCIPHTLLRAWFTSGKLKDIISGYLDICRKILCYETRAGQEPRGDRSLDGSCSCGRDWLLFSPSDVSDCLRPRGLQPARLLCPWDSPGKSTERVAVSFSGCDYCFTHLVSAA